MSGKVISKSEDDGFLWPQPEAISSERDKSINEFKPRRLTVSKRITVTFLVILFGFKGSVRL